VWANNGDIISYQYSGTGALKNDFTRTGKLHWRGYVNDGVNSITRYYLNNFSDGFRQDGFDLFLGDFEIDQSSSPFTPQLQRKRLSYISSAAVFGLMLMMTYMYYPSEPELQHKALVIMFWVVSMAVSFRFLEKFGTAFVDAPCLRPLLPSKKKLQ